MGKTKMKSRMLFALLLVLLCGTAGAQDVKTLNLSDTAKCPPAQCIYRSDLQGLSPNTAFLVYDLSKLGRQLTKEDTVIINKYSLIQKRDGIFVGAFLDLPQGFDAGRLSEFGIKTSTNLGSIVTVLIPIERLVNFCEADIANYIDIGHKAKPLMDNAKSQTNVNPVNQGIGLPQGYCGKDVVVGIIDVGFDYTHPNFWDSTLTNYRIKRVWEQENNSGTAPQPYDYGSEFTTAASIQNELYSHSSQSHGTHVAGIAAGGGTTIASSKPYRGVAPEADLVLVATNGTDPKILQGIDYIIQYAQSVGKPCVINMSLGHYDGPHDGTSPFDLSCDAMRQECSEGVLLVGASGNAGGSKIHISQSFTPSANTMSTFLLFNGQTAGSGSIDIWGDDDFTVSIRSYNTNQNNVSGEVFNVWSGTNLQGTYLIRDGDIFFPDSCFIYAAPEISPYNNKHRVFLYIDNSQQDDNYKPLLITITASSGDVHMWTCNHNATDSFVSLGYSDCRNGNDLATCGEIGGTGNSMISVGAYNSKTVWTDINGVQHDGSYWGYNYQESGDIACFSSKGPTVDLRIKPDITAPGYRVVSSVNSYDVGDYPISSTDVVSGVSASGHNYLYACMQGTSMAAPVVTGVLALWLEAYPELTITQTKQLIRETAIHDTYTGNIDTSVVDYQNIIWGAGKIDAYAGMQRLLQKIPARHIFNAEPIHVCGEGLTTLSAPAGYARYLWSNGDTTQTINVSQTGGYSVRLISAEGYKSPWSDTVQVYYYALNTPVISGSTDICQGSSTTITIENATEILWNNGQNINSLTVSPSATRYYGFSMTDLNGCSYSDSVLITVHPIQNIALSASICEGATYTENGFDVSDAGTYTRVLQSASGCDSVVTLTLSVNPVYSTVVDATINEGETYTENGFNASEAGTYIQTLQSELGCDSTITLNLAVNASLYDIDALEYSFHPNPTSGKITFDKQVERVDVVDMNGKVVATFLMAKDIDLGELPAGAYSLKISVGSRILTRKVIKE